MTDRAAQQQAFKPRHPQAERPIERITLDRRVPGETGGMIWIRVSIPRVSMHLKAMAEMARP